ncbi:immunoglobulin superfamily member 1-like [Paroedura picta]|uniref:immunoglobulin superfamily member 1-like n=1 Tax=Paroedura picta TaxID=143630 RepID=UPI0040579236
MRVPLFRILFMGCWMAGQSWTVAGQDYRKPSVSVRPEMVTLGDDVTVHCRDASRPDTKFSLYKKSSSLTLLRSQVARGYEAEFTIYSTGISDAGVYRCLYCFNTSSGERCSDYSDEVRINIADSSIPKPSIEVKPGQRIALHSSITIECHGQANGLNYLLRERSTGKILSVANVPTDTAQFHFPLVRKEDAGSYTCQYHQRRTPFVWSPPSDPVELNVEGHYYYRKPSVSVSPEMVTLGGDVTVRCSEARHTSANFSLYKINSSLTHLCSQKASGNEAKFIMSSASIPDAGVYRCLYCFSASSEDPCSEYSDEVRINIADPGIPKPSIKVKPGQRTALHSSITIKCQGEEGVNFVLRKANTVEISREPEAQLKADFPFPVVRREDAGSYTCQYHRRNAPFVWSAPSDPVELIVMDPGLAKPSIRVRPEKQHKEGTNVTIECEGPENGLMFSLHKPKNLVQKMKAEGNTAQFPLSPLRRKDGGNYSCQYYNRGNPFVSSQPSDHVRVVITGGSKKDHTTIIWASAAAGLLLVLFLLVLILVLCRKRRRRSTIKEGSQPVNRLLEQNAGPGQDDRADEDGVTYAVLNQHALKTVQPASQDAGPESCVYASVAKERSPLANGHRFHQICMQWLQHEEKRDVVSWVVESLPGCATRRQRVYMTGGMAGDGALGMRFSFSILLLGWWTVGQRGTSREVYRLNSEPTISVTPGTTVALGENATIHCRSTNYHSARFFLYKQGVRWLAEARAVFNKVTFPMVNIGPSDQGIYRCIFCISHNECSQFSASIEIRLAAQLHPKPSISVGPREVLSIGGSANICCNSENNPHTDFYLYKQGASLLQKAENIKFNTIVFPLTNVQQSDGGIYWCAYCIDLTSDKQCSNFSDNIYINITDPGLGRPSISVQPWRHLVLDSNVTIECQGPENGLNFSLYKASHLIASQMSGPSRNITNFALSMKKLEDAGNYACRYHHKENPFVWSELSNPVELIVTERSMITVWAGCAAGLVLVVLLLLIAFILYRKRRKGPQTSERSQIINTPLDADAKAVYEEVSYGTDLDGITYAVLNQDSLRIKQKTVPESPPESCVYTSVAGDKN